MKEKQKEIINTSSFVQTHRLVERKSSRHRGGGEVDAGAIKVRETEREREIQLQSFF